MRRLFRALIVVCALSLAAGCSQAATVAPSATPLPIVVPSTGFDKLIPAAQTFIGQLAKGDFAGATSRFDDTMKGAAPAGTLQQIWQQLISQFGAFKQQAGTRTNETAGYRNVFVTCEFANMTVELQVTFNTLDQISGFHIVTPSTNATSVPYSPPPYVNTGLFHEADVTVGSGQWALPGTLTEPNGSGPFPAVVLVHGSGPNDRDETIGPSKPFRDLAWGLASQGVAVLRYDKRTYAHKDLFTPDILAKLTTKEETTDDALSAVQLLRQTAGIDTKRIFVLGHSLGAMLAPRIGQQEPALGGLIIMAGPTRPFEDVILDQYTYLYSLNGGPTSAQVGMLAVLKAEVAAVKDPNLSTSTPASDLPLGIYPVYWLDLRGYRPAEVAKSLSIPLLVLQGGRDYQVSAAKDFPGWQAALAGKANATLKLYPALNHLFITGNGPSTPTEYTTPGHVSPEVVSDISQWVLKAPAK